MELCCCNSKEIINSDVSNAKEQMSRLAVDAKKWRGLYKCLTCSSFWEERFVEDRFYGNAYLVKVIESYVRNEWGDSYLNKSK